jgi:dipeptidyl-peptidase III
VQKQKTIENMNSDFKYSDERFADLQMLRYRLNGFEQLPPRKKLFVYYLSKATLAGRDITTDQFGKYNIIIRKTLEAVYTNEANRCNQKEYSALEVYLKRLWFSNGIYHHYGCEKFIPGFSEEYLYESVLKVDISKLPLEKEESIKEFCNKIFPVIFNPSILSKRVNQADGEDLVTSSACNYYENVTQKEVEDFYNAKKDTNDDEQPSWGLNTKLIKKDGAIEEIPWTENGLYGKAIKVIIYWLGKALTVTENDRQKEIINLLIKYYRSGDLKVFDEYSIEWLKEQSGEIDFINGFIEVYGDPLGLKGSWEGIVEYKDQEATKRTQTICKNAQWFEDHSPVDSRFRKKEVKGVTANVVCAAMLGGDEYPSSAIGINLPNADWIRSCYGSKSVTIGNLTEAYNQAAKNNGFKEEFVIDEETLSLINRYGDVCDDLHTDLHECLGHGSGQVLPGVDTDALKAYGNTIEEARADLFGLYYIADTKLLDLGLLDNKEAYKSQYYTYMMNGLITQLTRIKPGSLIEEAHMRNRALIAHWAYEHSHGAISLIRRNDKTYVKINDYKYLRQLFAELLFEVQRIKSEGDFKAARELVEKYAVKVDGDLHQEVLSRYKHLDLAPYKGFINPWMKPVYDKNGDISDIELDYSETYSHQMLRYSKEYGLL